MGGSIHHRFVFIEAGVEDHRCAAPRGKGLDEIVIHRVLPAAHGLQPPGAVFVAHRRQRRPLLRTDLHHVHHERAFDGLLEVIRDGLREDGRCEGTERLAALDLGVDKFLHAGPAGMGEDGAVAQGARPPFAAALIPAGHMTRVEVVCRALQQGLCGRMGRKGREEKRGV